MRHCEKCNNSPCNCNTLNGENTKFHRKLQNLFGSPFFCRKQKKTQRFSSPNSPLSQEELEELQVCITIVNDLLLSLASESDPENRRQLQLHFLNMKGEAVKAYILCNEMTNEEYGTLDNDKKQYKIGRLADAGRDFVQINQVGAAVFILYNQLLSIVREESCEETCAKCELTSIDSETRRELAFNFGEFVSKNPNFLNIFFGIPLYLKLKQFLGKDVKVKTYEEFYSGALVHSNEGTIRIKNKDGDQNINIEEICYLEVLNLK